MKEFFRKYINNELTSEDLKLFKQMSDEQYSKELDETMEEEWQKSQTEQPNVSDQVMNRVKRRLDSEIMVKPQRVPVIYKTLAWAASILLPVLILSTIYLYNENSQMASEQMVVCTSQGEKATITLPDGSLVTLNSNSRLVYTPKNFNKESRRLDFMGEGYFDVAKNKDKPFIIDGRGLQVKVLGTKFNLLARDESDFAELYLESGIVEFSSLKSQESVIMQPNKKVILNQRTGKLTLIDELEADAVAWKNNEMVFRNAPLHSVVNSISDNYHVDIRFKCQLDSTDLFTGTLVTDDLNSVLAVLEMTYGLKAVLLDGVVTLE